MQLQNDKDTKINWILLYFSFAKMRAGALSFRIFIRRKDHALYLQLSGGVAECVEGYGNWTQSWERMRGLRYV